MVACTRRIDGGRMADKVPAMPFINHQRDGETLVTDLCNVPDIAALETAQFFEHAAEKLRERHAVWQRQQAIERQIRNQLTQIARLPGEVLDLMIVGHGFEVAADIVADKQGVPRETVYSHWLKAINAIEKKSKKQRNNDILEMAANGAKNCEIAGCVGISSRQVRRVLQAQKRQLKGAVKSCE